MNSSLNKASEPSSTLQNFTLCLGTFLEYFDLIKYHFQVGRLLKGKSNTDLYQYISEKIGIKEIKEMLSLFLLKEIMNCFQQDKTAEFETQMLTVING